MSLKIIALLSLAGLVLGHHHGGGCRGGENHGGIEDHHGIKHHHGIDHHGGHHEHNEGHKGRHGGDQKGGCHQDQKAHQYSGVADAGSGFLKTLEHLGKKIKSLLKKAKDFHISCDTKKWNVAFNDAIDTVAEMCAATGKEIDNVFPGLDSKFNDHICSKPEYGSLWGCHRYDGSYSSVEEILRGHNVINAKKQIMDIMNKYKGKKGVEGFDENIHAIMDSMLKVAENIDKIHSHKGSREQLFIQTLNEFYVVLFGVLNNFKSHYGEQFIDYFIKFFKTAFVQVGYPDVSGTVPDVKKRISKCGPFDWDQAAISNGNKSRYSSHQSHGNKQDSNDDSGQSSSDKTYEHKSSDNAGFNGNNESSKSNKSSNSQSEKSENASSKSTKSEIAESSESSNSYESSEQSEQISSQSEKKEVSETSSYQEVEESESSETSSSESFSQNSASSAFTYKEESSY